MPAQGAAPPEAVRESIYSGCDCSASSFSATQAGAPGLSLKLRRQASEIGSAAFYSGGTPRKGAAPGSHARHRTWLRRHALGVHLHAVYAEADRTASAIYRIGDLVTPARFDYDPFRRPHRLPPDAIIAAKMACRRAFNSLLRCGAGPG